MTRPRRRCPARVTMVMRPVPPRSSIDDSSSGYLRHALAGVMFLFHPGFSVLLVLLIGS